MTYVDSAVLDFTEQMCRRFQTWTGRTNVWLAFQLTNLSIVVYFIWVTGLYFLSVDFAFRLFVALFCGGGVFLVTRSLFNRPSGAPQDESHPRAGPVYRTVAR